MKPLASSCRMSVGVAVVGLASTVSLAQTVTSPASAPRTPMANLFLSIAAKEGIELESFGDSTGRLEI